VARLCRHVVFVPACCGALILLEGTQKPDNLSWLADCQTQY